MATSAVHRYEDVRGARARVESGGRASSRRGKRLEWNMKLRYVVDAPGSSGTLCTIYKPIPLGRRCNPATQPPQRERDGAEARAC